MPTYGGDKYAALALRRPFGRVGYLFGVSLSPVNLPKLDASAA